MKFLSLRFGRRKGFGKGKFALDPAKLAEAMRLKEAGVSTNQAAKLTGLHRATVDNHWQKQRPLTAVLDDLSKQTLRDDPELAAKASETRALTIAAREGSTSQPQPTDHKPELTSKWGSLERRVMTTILTFTFRYWREYDPEQLAQYGRLILDQLLWGERDLTERVLEHAVQEEPTYRRQVADLAMEELIAKLTPKPRQRKKGRAPTSNKQFVHALARQHRGQQAFEAELAKAARAALGPGGAITTVLEGMFGTAGRPPSNTRTQSLPAPLGAAPGPTTSEAPKSSAKPRRATRAAKRPPPTTSQEGDTP